MLYQRVLLKVSGEFLAGSAGSGIDYEKLTLIAKQLAVLAAKQLEIGLVVGGGNLVRGEQIAKIGIDRVAGDQMGILATNINGIALRDALEKERLKVKLLSATPIDGMLEAHNPRNVNRYLSEGEIIVFCGGTGNPYFTTDTAACLRAIEIKANIMLKGTKVDGIYAADPLNNQASQKFSKLSYQEVIEKNLQVMDFTAVALARAQGLPLRVFNITKENMIINTITSEDHGTLIN